MQTAREHLGGAVSGGAFYVLAGRTAQTGNLTVAERYVPAERRWEKVPDLRKASAAAPPRPHSATGGS